MKRLLSLFLLAAFSCVMLGSCEHMSGPSYIGEYAGHIESTDHSEYDFAGFYVDLTLYDDNTCVLITGVIQEDNYTVDEVRHQNFKYGNVTDTGFDVLNGTGVVVASARYCGPVSFPDGEIALNWSGIICPEWGHYAVPCGWDLPCVMTFYSQNGSDITGW